MQLEIFDTIFEVKLDENDTSDNAGTVVISYASWKIGIQGTVQKNGFGDNKVTAKYNKLLKNMRTLGLVKDEDSKMDDES